MTSHDPTLNTESIIVRKLFTTIFPDKTYPFVSSCSPHMVMHIVPDELPSKNDTA